eukprot:Gb_09334 [translate_table: standard]
MAKSYVGEETWQADIIGEITLQTNITEETLGTDIIGRNDSVLSLTTYSSTEIDLEGQRGVQVGNRVLVLRGINTASTRWLKEMANAWLRELWPYLNDESSHSALMSSLTELLKDVKLHEEAIRRTSIMTQKKEETGFFSLLLETREAVEEGAVGEGAGYTEPMGILNTSVENSACVLGA